MKKNKNGKCCPGKCPGTPGQHCETWEVDMICYWGNIIFEDMTTCVSLTSVNSGKIFFFTSETIECTYTGEFMINVNEGCSS